MLAEQQSLGEHWLLLLNSMTPQDKDRIAKALQAAGATRPCSRCGNAQFTLLDGYLNLSIQSEPVGHVFGGPSVPTVGVACTKCGHLNFHALLALPGMKESAGGGQ
jgi:ribosomal protein L37E